MFGFLRKWSANFLYVIQKGDHRLQKENAGVWKKQQDVWKENMQNAVERGKQGKNK